MSDTEIQSDTAMDSEGPSRLPASGPSVSWVYDLNKEELVTVLTRWGLEISGSVAVLRRRLVAAIRSVHRTNTTSQMESKPSTDVFQSVTLPSPPAPVVPVCEMVRKWNTHFDGKTDPVSFLERLAELQKSYNVSNRQLLAALPELLRGSALLWLRNNRDDWESWDDFLSDFKDFYLSANYFFQLEEDISRRRQRQNEKGRDYVTEMRTMIRRHGQFTTEQEIFRVYNNMLPEYRQYIHRRDVPDMQSLIHEIEEYESLQREMRSDVRGHRQPKLAVIETTQPSLQVQQTTTSNAQCWRCGEMGHLRPACKNASKLFCWRCNRQGILTRDCNCGKSAPSSSVQKERLQPPTEIAQLQDVALSPTHSRHDDHDNRLHVDVTIKGISISALVDTGATHSSMSSEAMKRLGLQFEKSTSSKLQLADGQIIESLGKVQTECLIQGIQRPLEFLCLPQLLADIILGMDALLAYHMSLCFATNRVKIDVDRMLESHVLHEKSEPLQDDSTVLNLSRKEPILPAEEPILPQKILSLPNNESSVFQEKLTVPPEKLTLPREELTAPLEKLPVPSMQINSYVKFPSVCNSDNPETAKFYNVENSDFSTRIQKPSSVFPPELKCPNMQSSFSAPSVPTFMEAVNNPLRTGPHSISDHGRPPEQDQQQRTPTPGPSGKTRIHFGAPYNRRRRKKYKISNAASSA